MVSSQVRMASHDDVAQLSLAVQESEHKLNVDEEPPTKGKEKAG